MLTNEELRQLSKVDNKRSAHSIAHTWAWIIGTFYVMIHWPNPFTIIFGMILMARHQLSLAILMHDGAHKRLFTNLLLNDYLGQFLLASPVLFSLNAYRVFHLKHHQNPLAPDDPDITLTGGYPIPKASFARKLMRDVLGISYFKFIKYFVSKSRTNQGRQSQATGEKIGPSFVEVTIMTVLVNVSMFYILHMFGKGWAYFIYWLVPAMTILQLLLRVRGVTEHAGYQPNPDQKQNARTVLNPAQTFFFAPNNVNYHMEHHEYPSIPWYNLPRVHQLMMERGSLPLKNIFYSYADVLKQIVY